MDASTPLVPQPQIWLRVTILAILATLVGMGDTLWYAKFAFCLAAAGFFGTFPRPCINATYFEKQWFVFFVPVYLHQTQLADVVQIETDVESHMGMAGGCVLSLVVGLQNAIMVWLLDWLIPWAGGDYKLWLRIGSDQRVLAWQGNGESNFQKNLGILEDISELPVTRG